MDNTCMNGIQFVTDDKGRKVAVLIDLKRHAVQATRFLGRLISEKRRREKGVPLNKIKADLSRRGLN